MRSGREMVLVVVRVVWSLWLAVSYALCRENSLYRLSIIKFVTLTSSPYNYIIKYFFSIAFAYLKAGVSVWSNGIGLWRVTEDCLGKMNFICYFFLLIG